MERSAISPKLIEPISIDERSDIGHNHFDKLPNKKINIGYPSSKKTLCTLDSVDRKLSSENQADQVISILEERSIWQR